jgi:hypothetical protein
MVMFANFLCLNHDTIYGEIRAFFLLKSTMPCPVPPGFPLHASHQHLGSAQGFREAPSADLQLVAAAGETHHRHEPRVAVAMG